MSPHAPAQRLTTFRRGGFTFDVDDHGPLDGEVVICLHGFPQSRTSWTEVATTLADSGLRVLAPDQRGYSPGARPERRRDYAFTELVDDVVALADAVSSERVHVVGHDWGGIVAWHLAATHPERLASLTVLSTPHPRAMVESMVHSRQLLSSWYMAFFQLPRIPEWLFGLGTGSRARDALRSTGLDGPMLDESVRLLSDPATARAMLNWYRALPFSARTSTGPIAVPTAFVWGANDGFLGRNAAERTARWVTAPYEFVEVPGASHWLPEQHAELVAQTVQGLVARGAVASPRPS